MKIKPDLEIGPFPEEWLPFVIITENRPSIAPGEWPLAVYKGRVLRGIEARIAVEHLPEVPQYRIQTETDFERQHEAYIWAVNRLKEKN